jgi:tryptophan-rich sensory protein
MYIIIMLKNKFLTFILFLIITFSASLIGGMATVNFKEPWYSSIIRPSFSPPDWIFAPVWTTLYLMMTIAIWLFWHSKNRDMKTIYIYFIHIIINTTWSITFFVFHKILISVLVLVTLIIMIIILIKNFKRVNLISSYLMIPYLLWSCFALVLNLSIYYLN